jgi:hypothetical protein
VIDALGHGSTPRGASARDRIKSPGDHARGFPIVSPRAIMDRPPDPGNSHERGRASKSGLQHYLDFSAVRMVAAFRLLVR